MEKLGRTIMGSLVGACAGAAAGVLIVGLLGALSGIPYLLSHTQPDGLLGGLLAAFVMYGLFMGLPLGAPIGFILGLIIGAIRGLMSKNADTVDKPAPARDEFAGTALRDKAVSSQQPASPHRLRAGILFLLAIPGGLLVVWLAHGMWEDARFNRFADKVARLGGHAELMRFEDPFPGRKDVDLDLSSTATDDASLEQLVRDPVFKQVTNLNLAGTQITDRSLAILGECRFFQVLNLSHTLIGDQGFASMSQCYANTLNLSGTRVTDAILPILERQARNSGGRSIDLTDTRVTAEGVRALGKRCTMINLSYGSAKSPEHTR